MHWYLRSLYSSRPLRRMNRKMANRALNISIGDEEPVVAKLSYGMYRIKTRTEFCFHPPRECETRWVEAHRPPWFRRAGKTGLCSGLSGAVREWNVRREFARATIAARGAALQSEASGRPAPAFGPRASGHHFLRIYSQGNRASPIMIGR